MEYWTHGSNNDDTQRWCPNCNRPNGIDEDCEYCSEEQAQEEEENYPTCTEVLDDLFASFGRIFSQEQEINKLLIK
jgi:hypothetical protein